MADNLGTLVAGTFNINTRRRTFIFEYRARVPSRMSCVARIIKWGGEVDN